MPLIAGFGMLIHTKSRRTEKLDENAQGTGLGLSICQLIIEQLGGKIWIDPDYNQGARFLFTHPINKQVRKEDIA